MKTNEKFIEELKEINKDLSTLEEYKGDKKKIKFFCNKHKYEFSTTPNQLLHGGNCCYCSGHKINYKEKCSELYGDLYDYSLVDFEANRNLEQSFICKEHGVFRTSLYKHIYKKIGCQKCSGKYHYNIEEWREMATLLRGEEYDYSLSSYKRCDEKVEIICRKCGAHIWQTPENHINKWQGCSCHNNYKGEEAIRKILDKEEIKYIRNWAPKGMRLSYDFYIEEMNICIEFNGIQHSKWIKFFQPTLHDFYKQKHHDWLKRKYTKDNKINLLIIKYSDDILKKLSVLLTAFRN